MYTLKSKVFLLIIICLATAAGAAAQTCTAAGTLKGKWRKLVGGLSNDSGVAYQKSDGASQLILQAGGETSYFLDLEKRQLRRLRTKLPAGAEFELPALESEALKDACALVIGIPGTPKFSAGMTYIGLNVLLLQGNEHTEWRITRFAQADDDAPLSFTIGACPPGKFPRREPEH